jgi:hypothetical protein
MRNSLLGSVCNRSLSCSDKGKSLDCHNKQLRILNSLNSLNSSNSSLLP